MSLTEPDLWISHIRLFSRTHGQSGAPFAVRAVVGGVRYSVQCPAHVPSSLCVLLPTPSSGPTARAGHYPGYTSNMSWSDCHTAIPPPCLLSACWRLPERAARLSQVPMQTVGLPATDSDPNGTSPV